MCAVRVKLDLGDCRPTYDFHVSERFLPVIERELRAGNIQLVELITDSGLCRFRRK